MYTRMLVQVRQCKIQTYTMHMNNATTKPKKTKRSKTKTYQANQNKSQRSKGVTNPKLPSQASKGVLLKRFGENICGLPLLRDMDKVYVTSLMVISQEMEPDIYVFD